MSIHDSLSRPASQGSSQPQSQGSADSMGLRSNYSSSSADATNVSDDFGFVVIIDEGSPIDCEDIAMVVQKIFGNRGTVSHRTILSNEIKQTCQGEFKTLSLHVHHHANSTEMKVAIRLKGASNRYFDNHDDAIDHLKALSEVDKQLMLVNALRVRVFLCLHR